MTKLNMAGSWFNRTATNPPIWMRCAYVPIFGPLLFLDFAYLTHLSLVRPGQ